MHLRDARLLLENTLVVCHLGMGLLAMIDVLALRLFLGGIFATWWLQGLLLLPLLIALLMLAALFRRVSIFGYLVAGTVYWLLYSVDFLQTVLEGGTIIGGLVTGVAGVIVTICSAVYLGWRVAGGKR